ncbi:hypothetical protein VTN02DRAFT_2739 [Thermoascus thermophilus]
MMLEAQFGPNIAPIERPRLPKNLTLPKNGGASTPIKTEPDTEAPAPGAIYTEEEEQERIAELEEAELARLHALGIQVPGIEIKVDKHVARVWLENLEVECSYPVLRDRVRVVVERAVETVAPMWAEGPPSAPMANGSSGKGGVLGGEKKAGLANEAEAEAEA